MLTSTGNRQRGFMAIVLVVFLVVFVAIAAAIVSMTTSGARGAGDHAQASAALFIAESGIEWAARDLFDTDDPQADCNALAGNTGPTPVNGGGSFDITESAYDSGDGSCRVTSVGTVGQTRRVLKGKIPENVLEGNTGSGDDLFDDESAWKGGNNEVEDGVLYINKQGSNEAHANGDEVLTDDWQAGDAVYFAANVDPHAAGLTVRVRFPGNPNNHAVCSGGDPCASVDPNNPLHDSYDTVWLLSPNVSGSADAVNDVRIEVDFGEYSVSQVAIANGCIGRVSHCQGAAGDDPTEDGSWDEDP